MNFNIIATREGKLRHNISYELASKNPNIDKIMIHIKQYEKDNLDTIEKLRRVKKIETNKIKGGLKSTIQVHGPITMILIGSATKRIYGSLLADSNTQKENRFKKLAKKIKRWIN